jgi:predicted small metal-binding protein
VRNDGKEAEMVLKVQCECGFTYRSDDEDDFVAVVQKHGKEVHNMEVTREQALAMAQPA